MVLSLKLVVTDVPIWLPPRNTRYPVTPTLSVLAVQDRFTFVGEVAVAVKPSRLRGIGHLRGHETDRLAALARELGALGADVTEHEDELEIAPARLHGGVFHTYDDHRLAMAAAVLGLVVPGVEVENVATTGKTFPGFAAQWQAMAEGNAH